MNGNRPAGGLDAQIRCAQPDIAVDLRISDGSTAAILGPNGAGKSTVLSILAGVRRAEGSRITYREQVIADRRAHLPPHRRPVVLMAQHAGLFPHLSVRANVAFGPRSSGLSRREVDERVERWMAAAGVVALADRRPSQLSGGQTQRVALARALAAEPDVLLLDEPFSALDITVAQEIRSLVRELVARRDGVTVVVTHDLLDAVGLADQLVVLEAGRVSESGPTTQVLRTPTTPFVAALAGTNLVFGTVDDDAVRTGDGLRVVGVPVAGEAVPVSGSTVAAAFSPRAVAVYTQAPHGSPRNTLDGVVVEVSARGDHAMLRVACGAQIIAAEVTWAAVAELRLGANSPVTLSIKATEVRIYPVAATPG
ncbi:ATP-binding cassette domain-containing protein [Gordonia sp. ABSL1-1]|uniref:sulfate/molybdate ABC transporter ATP-binding protein n=1 Tax=Gordonia sp. ABSL1-1 TaxID=3053923 RepID=UPI002572C474|nr:ATP-binding cassette domain-containing protein [Gordonia sp. ABSL1-1]MDL9935178.1 ATP-binding cassette domain-containing protein [Gordonia sp. ABSL1-1]